MPAIGKINFLLRINEAIKKPITFFCSLNDQLDPNLHISINENLQLWVARYCQIVGWKDGCRNSKLMVGQDYYISINYNDEEMNVSINDKKESNFIFALFPPEQMYISFGDYKNKSFMQERAGILTMKSFFIIPVDKEGNESTNIDNVPEPKILDPEMLNEFKAKNFAI
ncbi:MAG: hypothetical protein Q7R95_07065 [bacterium]|nr:hypothetical protein [bacterium]